MVNVLADIEAIPDDPKESYYIKQCLRALQDRLIKLETSPLQQSIDALAARLAALEAPPAAGADQVNVDRALLVGIGDFAGAAITTGIKRYVQIPFAMDLVAWTLVADAVGSIVIDVWRSSYSSFPPVVAGSIAGSEKPTLASAQKNQNLSPTTWSRSLEAGDVLAFNVASATTVKQVTLSLHYRSRL